MVSSFRVIQNCLVMFSKEKQRVFFAELIQVAKVKYFGTALVLGGLVVLAAVAESYRADVVLIFNVPDDVSESQVTSLEIFD